MTLRVGIIGCGHACSYIAAFGRIQSTSVVALCARPDDERRGPTAQKYGIGSLYDDHVQMLEREKLDIVVVGSPPNCHRQHVCDSLEAGCHVLCEKPPCLSLAEAEACFFRALACDLHLEFGLCYRSAQGLPPPRPYLSTVHVRWQRTTAPRTAWAHNPAISGGGVLADLGSHALDIGLYAFGDLPVQRVQGQRTDGSPKGAGVEATFHGLLDLGGGKRLLLDLSWAAEEDKQVLICHGDAPSAPPHSGRVEDTTALVADDNIYWRTASAFLAHCFGANRARQLEITARGVTLQRLLDALYQSARAGGQPVSVR